jgi:hypothetical protein
MRLRLLAVAAAVTALPLMLGGVAASASSTAPALHQKPAAVASAARPGQPGPPAKASPADYSNDCNFQSGLTFCYILANYAESSGCWFWAAGYSHGQSLTTECYADKYEWSYRTTAPDGVEFGFIIDQDGSGYCWNYNPKNGEMGLDDCVDGDTNEEWGMVPTDDGSWCIKNLTVGTGGGCVYFRAHDGDLAIISSPNQAGSELYFQSG